MKKTLRKSTNTVPELLKDVFFVIICLIIILLLRRFVIEKFEISERSMETTLFDKDIVLAEKVSGFFSDYERFDVIIFTKSQGTGSKTYVKRVIGLPGEKVLIADSKIYINGEVISEDYGSGKMGSAGIASVTRELGENEYFVLGDNREISIDSRSSVVGTVKKNEIEGKVIIRLWPFSRFGRIN